MYFPLNIAVAEDESLVLDDIVGCRHNVVVCESELGEGAEDSKGALVVLP